MTYEEAEPGIQRGGVEHLKDPRPRRALRHRAAEKIDPLTKKVDSVLSREAELLVRLDKDSTEKTSYKPPQIRRRESQAHECSAINLTCDEADVDELLSAGELT